MTRGQEIEGEVILITDSEIILDLGGKSEGVLPKKDLSLEQAANLKVGDKLLTFVVVPENESHQVVLELHKTVLSKTGKPGNIRLDRFILAKKNNQVLTGKGLEVNKGGLIVEIDKVRGFLPSSLVTLSQAANMDELIDKDIQVTVVEVDPAQNRLILSQKTNLSEEIKSKLSKLKAGDKVEGEVAAVLPFGVFISLPDGVEGLVHVSEMTWDKVEDPNSLYKIEDKVTSQVMSIDSNTGRANLSIKQLVSDPFKEKASSYQPDDIVKATITKVTTQGVYLDIEGIEGVIPSSKMEGEVTYEAGKSLSCLVDSVDEHKRRINLAPFRTSTKDLIYK